MVRKVRILSPDSSVGRPPDWRFRGLRFESHYIQRYTIYFIHDQVVNI